MSWSAMVDGFEVVGASFVMPTGTVWRCTSGFAERQATGGVGGSPVRLRRLAEWMALEGSDLRLHLVLEVGGEEPSVAWLGLSAVGASVGGCRARLQAAAADLGEALDTWGWFSEAPASGPVHDGSVLGVVAQEPGARGVPAGHRASRVLPHMAMLHRRPTRAALVFDLSPADTPPDVVHAIAKERRRARHLGAGDGWAFDPGQLALSEAQQALVRLWEQATSGTLRVRFHGTPPGGLLRLGLEEALSDDLGQSVALDDAPASVLGGWGRALHAVLGVMAAGLEGATDEPDDDGFDLDEIPF